MRIVTFLLLSISMAVATAGTPAEFSVHVLRHAEKQEGPDPGLTAAGTARALALAAQLADTGIEGIFSSDTRRTRDTVAPLAERLGLQTEIYDHRRQAELAAAIVSARRSVVVVGHSNTIAELVAALGGEAGPAVGEDEFDRLYIVRFSADGIRTERLRYGPGPAGGRNAKQADSGPAVN